MLSTIRNCCYAAAMLLLVHPAADAMTLSVKCGGHGGLSSINAALRVLQAAGGGEPSTINVSGACRENILVQNIDRLTLNAVDGASITDASNGTAEVIDVAGSKGFTLNGFTVTTTCDATCLASGGYDVISCYFGSDCLLINNVVSGAGNGAGIGVYALSRVTVEGGSVRNNWAGLFANDNGEMFVLGTTIQGNSYGVYMNHGGNIAFRAGIDGVTPTTITQNAAQGIYTNIGSSLNVKGPASISNNGAEGIWLALGSDAFIGGGGPGPVTISGNGGPGVAVNDASVALFGNRAQVTGNGQTDVACNATTAVTHGVLTNIGGGLTNCPEGAPASDNVGLNSSFIMAGTGSSVMRAFILTDSADPGCFVTLNESNAAGAGETVFCGVRAPSLYGGRPGVMLTVFFQQPIPDGAVLWLNVRQNGARQYGPPVVCLTSDGC